MRYDVSLDGEDNWQYTSQWDSEPWVGGYASGFQSVSVRSELMKGFEFFWLTYYEGEGSETFVPYQPAIISEMYYGDGYPQEIYSFDTVNHSLYIRCRYYMEWEPLEVNADGEYPGERQSMFSDWSESAIFGKDSTQIIPDEPTTYAAPIISDLEIAYSEYHGSCYLKYVQTTPESVWLANVYYMMTGGGQFDGLETQASINGGDWVEFDTADSGGDWCLLNGVRETYNYDVPIEAGSNVKLRIRFVGTHGPSPWSNVLEVNGGVDCPSQAFTDVDVSQWYHEGIDFAVSNGLFNGMSETTFEPNTAMTRAMLVTVLWRYEGSPMEGANSFTDVPDGQWYTDAVAWAAHNSIVGGVGDNRFDPNGNITREQMATILFRYSNSLGLDTSAREELSSFPDGNRVSSYAVDAVSWAVAEGLINGSDGMLMPQGNATRAQVATILMRFIENIVV